MHAQVRRSTGISKNESDASNLDTRENGSAIPILLCYLLLHAQLEDRPNDASTVHEVSHSRLVLPVFLM